MYIKIGRNNTKKFMKLYEIQHINEKYNKNHVMGNEL